MDGSDHPPTLIATPDRNAIHWRAVGIASLPMHMATVITDLTLLLDGRLWPGYTLASHPLLIDATGEALYRIGRCVSGLDYGVVPDLSVVPYFSITGALEAVILDQLTRDEWRTWVFPGRSGEGLTLFDAVVRARSSLPHDSSAPCLANAGAQP